MGWEGDGGVEGESVPGCRLAPGMSHRSSSGVWGGGRASAQET